MRQLLSLILVFFMQYSAHAVVDMKNAAFSDYWVDMMLTNNNYLLRVSRSYSSRSLFSGMFGFGWCSNLESKLDITLEGNLVLTDCGVGATSYYPANYNTQLINESVDKIIASLRQKDGSKGKKYFDDLKEQIRADHKMRTQLAGEVGFKILPVKNTTYLANGREVEKITFDGSNYVRNLPDGSSQKYDATGKLIVLADKSKKFLRIAYAAGSAMPSTVTDSDGNKFTFNYSAEKKIKHITGPQGLVSRYKFTGENLVSVTNSWQNTYSYTYDANHNLTRINLPDGTYKTISYIENKDWVKEFRDRDGCTEAYEFTMSTENPKDHYWSTAIKSCKGKTVYKSRYEFWYQMRPDKEKYLSRVLTEKNNQFLDISYHQDFPKPIMIRKNADVTSLTYLPNGFVKQKTVSLSAVQPDDSQRYSLTFTYDSANKIDETLTEYYNKAGKMIKKRKTQFKYDGGRLISAKNSEGQFVEIKYNPQGLIASINDQGKKEILIEYDPKTSKPTAIVRPSVGSITLAYGSAGELKKVQNKGGSSVSTQVYATFNNFLDMVGPVSTELSLNL